MAQQRMAQAAEMLDEYYGDQPSSAPRSIEMDLAKLEFMLRSNPQGSSGDWLEAIQARGGSYARRRAEAMALSLLGRSNASTTPSIDPSIVAAQGQDYLRRGDPERAAELLAAAARAESKPDRAIERAAQAAAAFASVERYRDAAALLAEVAIAKPQADQAANAHLQAAILVATHDPQSLEQLESMLRQHLKQWPAAETSASARPWLQKLLTGQQRWIDAAEIATAIPVEKVTSELLDSIAAQWLAALRENRRLESSRLESSRLESSRLGDATEPSSLVSQRFLVAYEPLRSNGIAAERFPLLVALLVDRELIEQAGLSNDVAGSDPFATALLAYRRRGTETDALRSPPPQVVDDATLRLMLDGRANPVLRPSIARLLARWEGNQDGSIEHAERLLWLDQVDESTRVIKALIRAAPAALEVTRRGANLLQSSGKTSASEEAVRLWDQLAGGAPQGSELWHEAKLKGMAALRDSGDAAEAQRRAQYVLLTLPAMSDGLRRQYEGMAK